MSRAVMRYMASRAYNGLRAQGWHPHRIATRYAWLSSRAQSPDRASLYRTIEQIAKRGV